MYTNEAYNTHKKDRRTNVNFCLESNLPFRFRFDKTVCSREKKVCFDERSPTFMNPRFAIPVADADHPGP